jgi:predicted PurR-regulated permease PerM
MQERTTKIVFLVILLTLLVIFGTLIRPFLIPALIAGLIAVICTPLRRFFVGLLPKRPYLAAFMTTLAAFLCVIIPLGAVVWAVAYNTNEALSITISELRNGDLAQTADSVDAWIKEKSADYPGLVPSDFHLRTAFVDFLKSVGKLAYEYSPHVVAVTLRVTGGLFLVVGFLFLFFAEGPTYYNTLVGFLPLKGRHKEILTNEIRVAITATFLGMIATAAVQGFLLGIGYWIAGISNPVVWGLVAVGVTLIPVVGGALMYVPPAIYLILTGSVGSGIFLLAFGIGIVSMVDNVIKPLVMRGRMDIHPVLIAMSLIGGSVWLGPSGIIVGPLVLVLLVAMLRIYRKEFLPPS